MNSPDFYKLQFKQIYILSAVAKHPVVSRILEQLPGLPHMIIMHKEEIPARHLNQYSLFLTAPQTLAVGRCPGSKGHICCNYMTIDLYLGCTIGCSYCIMQSYLNFSPIIVNVEIDKTITYITSLARKNPGTIIRIGTGEVGDSLLYDPLFRLSAPLITAFAAYSNIHFELKTKTFNIEHLLAVEPKGNTVIGFSLNPQKIITSEEGTAASLEQRIAAAGQAVKAGYRVSFHFDPIIRYPGWETDYKAVIACLEQIPGAKIAWISLGTFRYTPGLRSKMAECWYVFDEFALCKDKKFRYPQQIRKVMYKKMVESLRLRFASVPIYLCMESAFIWEEVFLQKPGKIPNICDIIKRVAL